MTEEEILLALAKRYAAPVYAFFPHVRGGTGFARDRTADAVAMGLYPSRGLDLHGFEIKRSRADWLRELKKPEKADQIGQFCSYWWIVLSDQTIIRDGELPSRWGLIVAKNGRLRTQKEAEKLECLEPDRIFLASLLRKVEREAGKSPTKDEIKAASQAAWNDGHRRGREDEERNTRYAKENLSVIKEAICDFEETSGIKFDSWSAGKIGEAVKCVLAGQDARKELEWLRERAERILIDIDKALKENR